MGRAHWQVEPALALGRVKRRAGKERVGYCTEDCLNRRMLTVVSSLFLGKVSIIHAL